MTETSIIMLVALVILGLLALVCVFKSVPLEAAFSLKGGLRLILGKSNTKDESSGKKSTETTSRS